MNTTLRTHIDAHAGPETERPADTSRLRMFDHNPHAEHPEPDVDCYLSPHDARALAIGLLASANHANPRSSMPSSAGIPAGARPPHAGNPQSPKQGKHQP